MSKASHREIIAEGTVIGSKWKIGKLVGEGACGRVYAVSDVKPSSCSFPLVAKLIPTATGKGKAAKDQGILCDTLYYEYSLFHGRLCEFPYRPNIPDIRSFHGVDADHGYRYLVMERFERDLVGYSTSVKPDTTAVAKIGLQILDGLEWLHNKGLLFIDVKPDNFMLNGDVVKFVDYGLVEQWATASGSREKATRVMAGTPSYASLDVHNCQTPMRKDDIESMGLVLISLFTNGVLPWFDSRSDAECKIRKIECDVVKLSCNNDCPELGEIITRCRDLKFAQKPDYSAYKDLLIQMRDRKSAPSAQAKSGKAKSSSSATSSASERPRAVKSSTVKKQHEDEDEVEVVVNDENRKVAALSNSKIQKNSKNGEVKIVEAPFDSHCKIRELDEVKILNPKIPNSRPVKEEPVKRKSPRLIEGYDKISAERVNGDGEDEEKEVEFLNVKKIAGYKEKNVSFTITSGRLAGTCFSFDHPHDDIADDRGYRQRTFGSHRGTAHHHIGRDSLISDSHLAVMWRYTAEGEPDIEIFDKKSATGSWLNNVKLDNTWKKAFNGDEIQIGATTLKILVK